MAEKHNSCNFHWCLRLAERGYIGEKLKCVKTSHPNKHMKIFFVVVLSLAGFSCMKNRCYECRDMAGNVKEKGCDKLADEIVTYGEARGWKCEVLPD